MDLFTNLLPYDGIVNYSNLDLSVLEVNNYFNYFKENINWQPDTVSMFGKQIVTKRKMAWFAENNLNYTYSKETKTPQEWNKKLLELKLLVEKVTNETYNSCLLNLYHNGSEGMSWHRDNEKELKKNGAIASISFGEERKFIFKHVNTKEKIEVFLENGSLLIMKGTIQDYWLHALPKTTKAKNCRINLTFRTILE